MIWKFVKQIASSVAPFKHLFSNYNVEFFQQAFNMEQTHYATQTLQDTKATVNAMKIGASQMKKEFKHINLDQIEVLNVSSKF